MPLTGDIGVRVVDIKSDQKTYLTSVDSSSDITYSPLDTSKETADWMPSLNAKLALLDDLYLRLALGARLRGRHSPN